MSRLMKRIAANVLFLGFAALWGFATAQESDKKPAPKPAVEVVFCLDTTGSMGGLIDAAKQKIWAICNQIAAGKPTPTLKVGLVAYRDRGDQYVTKLFELTDDLDGIHGQLMQFKAQGGGDFPESVNQALHEAVTKFQWSSDKKTLKMIFLVGDAPPQIKYADDVHYTETCKLAASKDIIINTVQCGGHAETRKHWQEICRLAEGSYVQIDQRGGPIVVYETPFDKDLARINGELAKTTCGYGDAKSQMQAEVQKKAALALPAAAAADRAAYFGNVGGGAAGGVKLDLVEAVKKNLVKLAEIKKEHLPPEMQKMTLTEQKAHLDKLDKSRIDLNKQANDLAQQRARFIAQKQAEDQKNKARDSFDNQVLQILQTQARRIDVRYDADKK